MDRPPFCLSSHIVWREGPGRYPARYLSKDMYEYIFRENSHSLAGGTFDLRPTNL